MLTFAPLRAFRAVEEGIFRPDEAVCSGFDRLQDGIQIELITQVHELLA